MVCFLPVRVVGSLQQTSSSQPKLPADNAIHRRDLMLRERATSDEIDIAIRSAGMGLLEEFASVVVETDASMSVIRPTSGELTALQSASR